LSRASGELRKSGNFSVFWKGLEITYVAFLEVKNKKRKINNDSCKVDFSIEDGEFLAIATFSKDYFARRDSEIEVREFFRK